MYIEEIFKCVTEARGQFENGLIPTNQLETLYHGYNPSIQDLGKFIFTSKQLFPLGNCGLTSIYLRNVLGFGEIHHGYYDSQPHTFLLLGESDDMTPVQ